MYKIMLYCDKQQRKDKNCKNEVKIGDIVLIEVDKVKRLNWRVARINKLIKSKNDVITVRNNNTRGTLRRTINRLYPFELCSEANKPETKLTFVDDRDVIVFGGEC